MQDLVKFYNSNRSHYPGKETWYCSGKQTRENMPTNWCGGKVVEKEEEKIEKYRDLAREVAKLWNVRVKLIPVVIRDNPKWFGGKDKWDGNISENCTDSDVGITWDGENSEKSSWNLRLLDATWCSS